MQFRGKLLGLYLVPGTILLHVVVVAVVVVFAICFCLNSCVMARVRVFFVFFFARLFVSSHRHVRARLCDRDVLFLFFASGAVWLRWRWRFAAEQLGACGASV